MKKSKNFFPIIRQRRTLPLLLLFCMLIFAISCAKEELPEQSTVETIEMSDNDPNSKPPIATNGSADQLKYRAALRFILFDTETPNSIFYNFSLADFANVEVFAQDCCIRDDVVEIYIDGCLLAVVDSRPGEIATHPGEFHTAEGLAPGDHIIEYRNVISSVGQSGWNVSETELPATSLLIDGCDAGLADQFLPSCVNMSDMIANCASGATNHGDFVSCVAGLTNTWKSMGLITGKQKGAIQSCAAQASIP